MSDNKPVVDDASDEGAEPGQQIARYLGLHFGGYFMCRLATDPDPTDDPYGTSGYTMALANEPVLDQVIRLQPDQLQAPLRANPLPHIQVGVAVNSVTFDGKADPTLTRKLANAKVNLEGEPTFVSRNNTVGSDDTMAFVVEPFHLSIRHKYADRGGAMTELEIEATDELIPGHPHIQSVDIAQPSKYARRFPVSFSTSSAEANQAIGVYDEYGYFRDRRRWLNEQIDKATDPTEKECFRTRIFQLESWGDRVINKLGFQATWSHLINGSQIVHVHGATSMQELLGGNIITEQPWSVDYWFGGWDGDLLVGYMAGSLNMPFVPNGSSR